MLTTFAIDPRGVKLDSGLGGSRASHERLLRLWARFGVLVCPEESSAVHRSVKDLPQELRKLWMTALKQARLRVDPRVSVLDVALQATDLVPLGDAAQVVLCGDSLAVGCGLTGDDVRELPPSGIEAVRITSSDASARFRESEDLANRPIDEGKSPEVTWRERFEVLTRTSRTIVVIDRYAAQRAWNAKRCAWEMECGLVRLLRRVAATGGTPELFLYSQTPEIGDQSFLKFFDQAIQSVGASAPQTTVRLAGEDFGSIAHGRSIRFDRLLCEVDLGLEVLEGAACYRFSSFSVKPSTDEHKRLEERLRNISGPKRRWERSGVRVTD